MSYTCPMHPQVRRSAPGGCPLCGMALEPVCPEASVAATSELGDMSRRFWIGLAFSAPLVLWEMTGHISAAVHMRTGAPRSLASWIELALATPVVLWAGGPFFARAWASVRNRSLNMFTLIALGVGAAYLYSVVASLAPGLFPPSARGADGAVAVYYEAAAMITVLVLLGQVLELRARGATGDAIRALLHLAPTIAHRINDEDREDDIPLEEVRPGDRLRIRPGDSVPVDGEVLEGESAVDTSMITGESLPVVKMRGARVIGGTLNGTGTLVMRAEQVGEGTVLARIVRLVVAAQRSRAPIQRLADIVSAWFAPAIVVVALVAFSGWLLWGPAPALPHALIAAVSVLIIACPCALGLATPMSIMVGIGKGATAGVLIRNGESLERLEKVDILVIDKTGTLTEGRAGIVDCATPAGFEEASVLALAASVERSSEHPLSGAIVRAARERALVLEDVSDFRSVPGQGVRGRVGGREVAVGNAQLIARAPAALEGRADAYRRQGATVVYVAIDGQLAGIFAIADPIKASTPVALARLRADGVRIVMLTGDHRETALAVAAKLAIADVEAEVRPEEKQAAVRRLRDSGHVVAMAGDGVNDAPALAAADVGIAMGAGSDAAMESAGVTLLKGDLEGIARARTLSRRTMRNIRENLVLAFVYNVLGVPLAAGVLYPAFGLLLSPVAAAMAMSFSSVSVIANALRLRSLRL